MKTGAMIKELTENPHKRFRCLNQKRMGDIVGMDKEGHIDWLYDGEFNKTFLNIYHTIQWEWEEVKQPVTFMEAINSGKKIRHEAWHKFVVPSEALAITSKKLYTVMQDMINGNWFIE